MRSTPPAPTSTTIPAHRTEVVWLGSPRLTIAVIHSPSPPAPRRRRPFLLSFIVFLLFVVVLNLTVAVAFDHGPSHLRDPEYGLRLNSLRQRVAEHPTRSPVVIVGSSRTGQGISPGVCEPSDGPLVFNMSQAGGGPLSQLLTLRRLWNDGIRPAGVVLEYWPPFLRGDGTYHEQHRIDPKRLLPTDEPTVREFFLTPKDVWAARCGDSFLPLVAHRHAIISRHYPELLPHTARTDPIWRNVDGWGWWPGRKAATPEQVEAGWPQVKGFYGPMYDSFSIHPQHAAAYRRVLEESRDRGVRVVLIRMPANARFRELQTSAALRLGEEFLNELVSEFGVRVIDARTWADADDLPDGFHLTQPGAEVFTRRVMPEVRSWWEKTP